MYIVAKNGRQFTFIDLRGSRYGKLVVKSFVGIRKYGRNNTKLWGCLCDCGTVTIVRGTN